MTYEFIVSRLGQIQKIEIVPGKQPRVLKEISIIDRALAERVFKF
jgi:hypothetical protein